MTFSTISVLAIDCEVIAESRRANVQLNAQILAEQFTQAAGKRGCGFLTARENATFHVVKTDGRPDQVRA
jgi:hypothetical protein